MPHIHDQYGQHDATVTGYIIRTDMDEPRILLHMHRKLGKLMPVGGHIEMTETPWQSIIHELREESGYDIAELCILQPKDRLRSLSDVPLHPYPLAMLTADYFDEEPGRHFHDDIAYAFVAGGEPAGLPEEGESLDIRWLTATDLVALPASEIFANVREIYAFALNTCLSSWESRPAGEFQA